MAAWKKEQHNLRWLPEKLRQLKDLGNLKLFERSQLETVVLTMLEFEPGVPEIQCRRFVSKAVTAAEDAGNYTPEYLVAEVNRQEKQFLALPRRRFTLATHVSLEPRNPLPTFRLDGATFTFSRRLPRRFSSARAALAQQAAEQYLRDGLTDDRYQAVRVTVAARSPEEAGDQAIQRFDLLRGLLNFPLNDTRMLQDRMINGRQSPINRILSGNLSTVHEPSGCLATQRFWFDPYDQRIERPERLRINIDKYFQAVNRLRKALDSSHYRGFIVRGLVRYTAALDRTDYDAAFMKLWSLLEYLTVLGNDRYEKMIKRVVFLADEPEYHEGILKHLQSRRNLAIHDDDQTATSQAIMLQTKFYVEALLRFHLLSRPRFSSLEEVAGFLDLPSDPIKLESEIMATAKRQRLLTRALHVQSASTDGLD